MPLRVLILDCRIAFHISAPVWCAVALLLSGCSREDYVLGLQAHGDPEPSTAGSGGGGGAAGAAGVVYSADPVLAAQVDVSPGGPNTRLLVGDVTGDGRRDLVTMQPDSGFDDAREPHEVVALTAFDLVEGIIWQIGDPDSDADVSAADMPAQIVDIDADGFNEVVAVMGGMFRAFDGRDGSEKFARDLPDPNAHDAIIIANFSGNPQPQDVVLKDRYDQVWAFDRDWNQLFNYVGTVGHYPWPYDWDEDGRDELMAGCNYLDHDGTFVWSCDGALDGTADAVFTGDLDQNPDNGAEILVGGGDTLANGWEGNQHWSYDTVEAQNVVLGDFRPDLPGLEVAGLDRVSRADGGQDALFLLSAQGEELFFEDREPGSGWNTIVQTLSNWDGSGRDFILAYSRGEETLPALYDGHFSVVATFAEPTAHFMHADLCGDEREEIIMYTDTAAELYATGDCDLAAEVTGTPRPQVKGLYNWTRWWGGEYP